MTREMWNAPQNKISRTQIIRANFAIVQAATAEAQEFDVRSAELYEALDVLEGYANKSWGFAVYRQGLELGSYEMLTRGLELIRANFKV